MRSALRDSRTSVRDVRTERCRSGEVSTTENRRGKSLRVRVDGSWRYASWRLERARSRASAFVDERARRAFGRFLQRAERRAATPGVARRAMKEPASEQKRPLRIAAAADVHCRDESGDALRSLVARMAEAADVLCLCGDLTDHGRASEAKVLASALATAAPKAVLGV